MQKTFPARKKARITFEVEPEVKRLFKGFCGSHGYEMKEVLEQAVLEILETHAAGITADVTQ